MGIEPAGFERYKFNSVLSMPRMPYESGIPAHSEPKACSFSRLVAERGARILTAAAVVSIGLSISTSCLADTCALLKQQMTASANAWKQDAGIANQQAYDDQAYRVAQKAWIDTCLGSNNLPGKGGPTASQKLNALSDLQNLIDEQSHEDASIQAAREAEIANQQNQELAREQMLRYMQEQAMAQAKARDDTQRHNLSDPFDPNAPAAAPDPNNPFSPTYRGQ